MPTVSDYDARRGSARSRGYDARWDRASKAYRAQYPLCVGCQVEGRVTVAALVDHIVPHRGDETLFWDVDNWQPCCRFHHDVVKQQLEHMFDHGAIDAVDLRLTSARALAISRRERSMTGADGWPTDR